MCSRDLAATCCEKGASLSTIETVETANPQARATSAKVTWPDFLWANSLSSIERVVNGILTNWPSAPAEYRRTSHDNASRSVFSRRWQRKIDPAGQNGEGAARGTMPDCQLFESRAVHNDFNLFSTVVCMRQNGRRPDQSENCLLTKQVSNHQYSVCSNDSILLLPVSSRKMRGGDYEGPGTVNDLAR